MFGRRATAPSQGVCEQAPASAKQLGAGAGRWLLAAWSGVIAMACGAPNPRILDSTEEARGLPSTELGNETTEQEKIAALITAVRNSEHVFVHDDIERSGEATADKLQLLLERDPTGVRSAREFIDRIAAPKRSQEAPDSVRLGPEELVLAHHWFEVRLAEIEGRPPPDSPPEEKRKAEVHARRLRILEALAFVERSGLHFVAPPRHGSGKPKSGASKGPKRKPKRKEYTAAEFADMLRKKWEFLGADIKDLDTFIDEIASDSFTSMVRYRVILEDGHEEDFGAWLRVQLAAEQARQTEGALQGAAQGGAP